MYKNSTTGMYSLYQTDCKTANPLQFIQVGLKHYICT